MISFKSDAHRMAYLKTKIFGAEIFGQMLQPRDNMPVFDFQFGSTQLYVGVHAWDKDKAVVVFKAYVFGPTVSPELTRHVIELNHSYRFGAWSMDDDRDLCFRYTVPGSSISRELIESAAMAVVSTADRDGAELASRFGGKTVRQKLLELPDIPHPLDDTGLDTDCGLPDVEQLIASLSDDDAEDEDPSPDTAPDTSPEGPTDLEDED